MLLKSLKVELLKYNFFNGKIICIFTRIITMHVHNNTNNKSPKKYINVMCNVAYHILFIYIFIHNLQDHSPRKLNDY